MEQNIPLARIESWLCQHGSKRESYVRPMSPCGFNQGGEPCDWIKKEGDDDEAMA